MAGSISRELNEIFYTLYAWCAAIGPRPAARHVAALLFWLLGAAAIVVIFGLATFLAGTRTLPNLAGSGRARSGGGLLGVLLLAVYFGFGTRDKVAFLESDYSDETPQEARRRQVKVAAIVALLALTLRQTLQLLGIGA